MHIPNLYALQKTFPASIQSSLLLAICQDDLEMLQHLTSFLSIPSQYFLPSLPGSDYHTQKNSTEIISHNHFIAQTILIARSIQMPLLRAGDELSTVSPTIRIPLPPQFAPASNQALSRVHTPNARSVVITPTLDSPLLGSASSRSSFSPSFPPVPALIAFSSLGRDPLQKPQEEFPSNHPVFLTNGGLQALLCNMPTSPIVSAMCSIPNRTPSSLVPVSHIQRATPRKPFMVTALQTSTRTLFHSTPILQLLGNSLHDFLNKAPQATQTPSSHSMSSQSSANKSPQSVTRDSNASTDRVHIPLPSPPSLEDFSNDISIRDITKKLGILYVYLLSQQGQTCPTPQFTEPSAYTKLVNESVIPQLTSCRSCTQPENLRQQDIPYILLSIFETISVYEPSSPVLSSVVREFVSSPAYLVSATEEKLPNLTWRIMRYYALKVEESITPELRNPPTEPLSLLMTPSLSNSYVGTPILTNRSTASFFSPNSNPFLDASASVDFLPPEAATITRSPRKKVKSLKLIRPHATVRSDKPVTDVVFDTIRSHLQSLLPSAQSLNLQLINALMPHLILLDGYILHCATNITTSLALSVLFNDLLILRHSIMLTSESCSPKPIAHLTLQSPLESHPVYHFPQLWSLISQFLNLVIHLAASVNDTKSALQLLVLFFGLPTKEPQQIDAFCSILLTFCFAPAFLVDPKSFVAQLSSHETRFNRKKFHRAESPTELQLSFSFDNLQQSPPFILISFLRSSLNVLTFLSDCMPLADLESLALTLVPTPTVPRSHLSFSDTEPGPLITWPFNCFDSILNPSHGLLTLADSSRLTLSIFPFVGVIHFGGCPKFDSDEIIALHSLPHSHILPFIRKYGYVDAHWYQECLHLALELFSVPTNPLVTHSDYSPILIAHLHTLIHSMLSFWMRPIPLSYTEQTDLVVSTPIKQYVHTKFSVVPLSLDIQFEITNLLTRLLFTFVISTEQSFTNRVLDTVFLDILALCSTEFNLVTVPHFQLRLLHHDRENSALAPISAFTTFLDRLHILKDACEIENSPRFIPPTITPMMGTASFGGFTPRTTDGTITQTSSDMSVGEEGSMLLGYPSLFASQNTSPTELPLQAFNEIDKNLVVYCQNPPFLSSAPIFPQPPPVLNQPRVLYVPLGANDEQLDPEPTDPSQFGIHQTMDSMESDQYLNGIDISPLSFPPTSTSNYYPVSNFPSELSTSPHSHKTTSKRSDKLMLLNVQFDSYSQRASSPLASPSVLSDKVAESFSSKSFVSVVTHVSPSVTDPSHISSSPSDTPSQSSKTPPPQLSHARSSHTETSSMIESTHSFIADLPQARPTFSKRKSMNHAETLLRHPPPASFVSESLPLVRSFTPTFIHKQEPGQPGFTPSELSRPLPTLPQAEIQYSIKFIPHPDRSMQNFVHPLSKVTSPHSFHFEEKTDNTQPSSESATWTMSSTSHASSGHQGTQRTRSNSSESKFVSQTTHSASSQSVAIIPSAHSSFSIRNASNLTSHSTSTAQDFLLSSSVTSQYFPLNPFAGVQATPHQLSKQHHDLLNPSTVDAEMIRQSITPQPSAAPTDMSYTQQRFDSVNYLPSLASDFTTKTPVKPNLGASLHEVRSSRNNAILKGFLFGTGEMIDPSPSENIPSLPLSLHTDIDIDIEIDRPLSSERQVSEVDSIAGPHYSPSEVPEIDPHPNSIFAYNENPWMNDDQNRDQVGVNLRIPMTPTPPRAIPITSERRSSDPVFRKLADLSPRAPLGSTLYGALLQRSSSTLREMINANNQDQDSDSSKWDRGQSSSHSDHTPSSGVMRLKGGVQDEDSEYTNTDEEEDESEDEEESTQSEHDSLQDQIFECEFDPIEEGHTSTVVPKLEIPSNAVKGGISKSQTILSIKSTTSNSSNQNNSSPGSTFSVFVKHLRERRSSVSDSSYSTADAELTAPESLHSQSTPPLFPSVVQESGIVEESSMSHATPLFIPGQTYLPSNDMGYGSLPFAILQAPNTPSNTQTSTSHSPKRQEVLQSPPKQKRSSTPHSSSSPHLIQSPGGTPTPPQATVQSLHGALQLHNPQVGLPPRSTRSPHSHLTTIPEPHQKHYIRGRSRSVNITAGVNPNEMIGKGELIVSHHSSGLSSTSGSSSHETAKFTSPTHASTTQHSFPQNKTVKQRLYYEKERIRNPITWSAPFHANLLAVCLSCCLDDHSDLRLGYAHIPSQVTAFQKLSLHLSSPNNSEATQLLRTIFESRSGSKGIALCVLLRFLSTTLFQIELAPLPNSTDLPTTFIHSFAPKQSKVIQKRNAYPFLLDRSDDDHPIIETVRISVLKDAIAQLVDHPSLHSLLTLCSALKLNDSSVPIAAVLDVGVIRTTRKEDTNQSIFQIPQNELVILTEPYVCSLKQWRDNLFESEADTTIVSLLRLKRTKQQSPTSKLSISTSSRTNSVFTFFEEPAITLQNLIQTGMIPNTPQHLSVLLPMLGKVVLAVLDCMETLRLEQIVFSPLSLSMFSLIPSKDHSSILPFRIVACPFSLLSRKESSFYYTTSEIVSLIYELMTGISLTSFSKLPPTQLSGLYYKRVEEAQSPPFLVFFNELLSRPSGDPVSLQSIRDDVSSILSEHHLVSSTVYSNSFT
ncbi:hypothetical protein BLNAU_8656 [Blattamonas nauphoetae]|uniref:Uncharacterized protein n=1 Tax=Blattamonas nauphoetae TaxID=2049346 RepID=A0ABQ9XY64_9EUKA|nr:hypothetical protein BLNAU_8656 [Blattamonas nauphoetae]